MKVKISDGNSKLGKIPNVSLTPIKSCPNSSKCKDKCYALKAYNQYPVVKNAWDNNYKIMTEHRYEYFTQIYEFLSKKKPKFFRWHVAGDIVDQDYFHNMRQIAKTFKDIKFLAFTKSYHIKFSNIPENLAIVISIWPELKAPRTKLPKAYMQDGTETRVENALHCPGYCEDCCMCWHLKDINKNVVFDVH